MIFHDINEYHNSFSIYVTIHVPVFQVDQYLYHMRLSDETLLEVLSGFARRWRKGLEPPLTPRLQ